MEEYGSAGSAIVMEGMERQEINDNQVSPAIANTSYLPQYVPSDVDALTELKASLEAKTDAPRGSIKFVENVNQYLYHKKLLEGAWTNLTTSLQYMRGIKTNGQAKGGKRRSLRASAKHFYEKLGATALRQHCQMYDLDYDSFETVDARIEALVEANLASM